MTKLITVNYTFDITDNQLNTDECKQSHNVCCHCEKDVNKSRQAILQEVIEIGEVMKNRIRPFTRCVSNQEHIQAITDYQNELKKLMGGEKG